jgi:hypothetical protein
MQELTERRSGNVKVFAGEWVNNQRPLITRTYKNSIHIPSDNPRYAEIMEMKDSKEYEEKIETEYVAQTVGYE